MLVLVLESGTTVDFVREPIHEADVFAVHHVVTCQGEGCARYDHRDGEIVRAWGLVVGAAASVASVAADAVPAGDRNLHCDVAIVDVENFATGSSQVHDKSVVEGQAELHLAVNIVVDFDHLIVERDEVHE